MLGDFGWGQGQFGCLDSLWMKESGWSTSASNGSSGAYGIPQSLPGSKMSSAGPDWQTNPATQIKWGLGYIKERYGSPVRRLGPLPGHHTGTDRPAPRARTHAQRPAGARSGAAGRFVGGGRRLPGRACHGQHVQRLVELGLGEVAALDVARASTTMSRMARRSATDSLATAAASS